MLRFTARRGLATVVQLALITFAAWLIFFVIAARTGANPAVRAAGPAADRAQIARVAHELGTDRPYYEQYARYVWRLLHGDLGESLSQRRPVTDIVVPAAGTTASLVLGGAVLWLALATAVGVVGAVRPRSVADRAMLVLALLGISMPVFWAAPMVAYAFAYEPTQGTLLGVPLGGSHALFPIDGYVNLRDDVLGWAHHLVLPWVVLAVGMAGGYARYIRSLVAEQLAQDYVRTAVAKGASPARVLRAHVARNVAPVVVTLLGADVGVALGGSFFIEKVFGLPGLGYTGLVAIETLDYPLVIGTIVFAAVVAVLANAIVDVVHGMLDPRALEAHA